MLLWSLLAATTASAAPASDDAYGVIFAGAPSESPPPFPRRHMRRSVCHRISSPPLYGRGMSYGARGNLLRNRGMQRAQR